MTSGSLRRIAEEIPGFNVRQLSLEDVRKFCERRDIEILFIPLAQLHGCSVYRHGRPYIVINSNLGLERQTIAAFHEAGHHLLHGEHLRGEKPMWSSTSEIAAEKECEAETVGAIAWTPDSLIVGLSVEEIVASFRVSRKTAEFRTSLEPP